MQQPGQLQSPSLLSHLYACLSPDAAGNSPYLHSRNTAAVACTGSADTDPPPPGAPPRPRLRVLRAPTMEIYLLEPGEH